MTGHEYKSSNVSAKSQKENQTPTIASATVIAAEVQMLTNKISQQGDHVRQLKANQSTPNVSDRGKNIYF